MQDIEEKILVRELGSLGGLGARLVARRLRMEAHETTQSLPLPIEIAYEAARETLEATGQITDEFPPVEAKRVSAIVGSGSMHLNPTIVHITLIPIADGGTQAHILAVAKEGLIKQHSAEKAVRRIRELLVQVALNL